MKPRLSLDWWSVVVAIAAAVAVKFNLLPRIPW
jgi:hypothetical protein